MNARLPTPASQHELDRAFLASLREKSAYQLRALRARLWREDDSPHRWRTEAVVREIARRGSK